MIVVLIESSAAMSQRTERHDIHWYKSIAAPVILRIPTLSSISSNCDSVFDSSEVGFGEVFDVDANWE